MLGGGSAKFRQWDCIRTLRSIFDDPVNGDWHNPPKNLDALFRYLRPVVNGQTPREG